MAVPVPVQATLASFPGSLLGEQALGVAVQTVHATLELRGSCSKLESDRAVSGTCLQGCHARGQRVSNTVKRKRGRGFVINGSGC